MKRRTFLSFSICATALLFMSVQAGVATIRQDEPLTLDGLRLQGEIIKSTLTRQDPPDYTYVLDLKLTFVNTGTRHIILLAGTYDGKWWNLVARLARSKSKRGLDKSLYWNSGRPAVSSSPMWKKLKETLDSQSPPQGATIIIPPKGSYTFYDGAVVVVPTDIVTPDSVLWVSVTYQMWPPGLENGSEDLKFGKKLRQRWEKEGYLGLDLVTSDPIMFDLKKWSSQ
jgi:hypothetical protein